MANVNLNAYSKNSTIGNVSNGDNYLYVHSIYQRFLKNSSNAGFDMDLTRTLEEVKIILFKRLDSLIGEYQKKTDLLVSKIGGGSLEGALKKVEEYILSISSSYNSTIRASVTFKENILQPILQKKKKWIDNIRQNSLKQADAITAFFSMVYSFGGGKIISDDFHKKALNNFLTFLDDLEKNKETKQFVLMLKKYAKNANSTKKDYDDVVSYLRINSNVLNKILDTLETKNWDAYAGVIFDDAFTYNVELAEAQGNKLITEAFVKDFEFKDGKNLKDINTIFSTINVIDTVVFTQVNENKKTIDIMGASLKLKQSNSLTKKYKAYDTLFFTDDFDKESMVNPEMRLKYKENLKTFLFFRRNFRALSKFNVVWMRGEKKKARRTKRSRDTTLETIDITNFALYKKYIDAEKEIAAIAGIDRFLNGFARMNDAGEFSLFDPSKPGLSERLGYDVRLFTALYINKYKPFWVVEFFKTIRASIYSAGSGLIYKKLSSGKNFSIDEVVAYIKNSVPIKDLENLYKAKIRAINRTSSDTITNEMLLKNSEISSILGRIESKLNERAIRYVKYTIAP